MEFAWAITILSSAVLVLISTLIAVLSWSHKRVLNEQDKKLEALFRANTANESQHRFFGESIAATAQWMKSVDEKLGRIEDNLNGEHR